MQHTFCLNPQLTWYVLLQLVWQQSSVAPLLCEQYMHLFRNRKAGTLRMSMHSLLSGIRKNASGIKIAVRIEQSKRNRIGLGILETNSEQTALQMTPAPASRPLHGPSWHGTQRTFGGLVVFGLAAIAQPLSARHSRHERESEAVLVHGHVATVAKHQQVRFAIRPEKSTTNCAQIFVRYVCGVGAKFARFRISRCRLAFYLFLAIRCGH